MERRKVVGGLPEAQTNEETEWTISVLLHLLQERHTTPFQSTSLHCTIIERMDEQDRVGWPASHLGEAGQVGNATSIVLIPSHEDIAFVAPGFSPAVGQIKKNT